MTPRPLLVAVLIVHFASFLVSCIVGPLRGHSFLVSALGGLALGPLNLPLVLLIAPPARGRKCPACAAPLPPAAPACVKCGTPAA